MAVVALFSGMAGSAALVGVYRIGRGPAGSSAQAPANAALALMVVGMLLDLAATKVTIDAFSGSLSSAFFAQDALPVLAGMGTGIGVFAGASILSSFRRSALEIGLDDVADGAATTARVLFVAGIAAALLQLAMRAIPAPLLIAIGVLVLPALLYVAVRFIVTAVALARAIDARLTRVHQR